MVEELRKAVRRRGGVLTIPDGVQAGIRAGRPRAVRRRGRRSLHDTFWTPFGDR